VKITWQTKALEDYRNWAATEPAILETINNLIDDIQRWGLRKLKRSTG
jgi:Txe/YoeB family toxin of Txe-Axe toxin-antitoxin module